MLNKACLLFLVVTKLISAQTDDSVLINYSQLNDSAKASALLEEVWEKRSNDPLTAIKLAKQALIIIKELNDIRLEAKALNFLGITHSNIGATEIAFDYHNAALKKSEEAEDRIQLAYSYNNIGGIFSVKNDFVAASENILKAVKIFEEEKENTGLAYCFINMGRLHKEQGNYEKSLQYLRKALELSSVLKNEDLKARVLLETSNIQFRKKEYKQALKTFWELEKLYNKINYLKGLAIVWDRISELCYKENNYKEALTLAEKALSLNRQILNAEGEINNLNNIALFYLSQNQINKGKEYLNEAKEKAIKINEADPLLATYKTHYEFYKKAGNMKNALEYFELYNKLKDSVYTNEEMIKFGELESLIKIEKTEKENQILVGHLELQLKQRNYLIIIIILAILAAAVITIRFYEKKKLSDELRKTNAVKDKFFRIISHDLREPFNAIFSAVDLLKNNYGNLSEKERKETIDSIGRLLKNDFELLENLLMWSKNQSSYIEFKPSDISLNETIRKNIALIQNNIGKKNITVNVECPDELIIHADEQMLNSILRNTIFNSVKFTNAGGIINISANKFENKIQIEISDNGIGMNREEIENLFSLENKKAAKGTAGESGSGIGLILTKEFVERHKGTITAQSETGKGSKFIITFPAV